MNDKFGQNAKIKFNDDVCSLSSRIDLKILREIKNSISDNNTPGEV
jgi:hypothetical protein